MIEGCEYYANLCNNTATGVTNCTACDTTSDKALLTAYTVRSPILLNLRPVRRDGLLIGLSNAQLVDEVFYCGTSSEQYCPNNDVCATCSGTCVCYNQYAQTSLAQVS